MVGFGVAPEVAPELLGLDGEHAAISHAVAKLGVSDFGIESTEPGSPKLAATGVSHEDTFGGVNEVTSPKFLSVEEGESD